MQKKPELKQKKPKRWEDKGWGRVARLRRQRGWDRECPKGRGPRHMSSLLCSGLGRSTQPSRDWCFLRAEKAKKHLFPSNHTSSKLCFWSKGSSSSSHQVTWGCSVSKSSHIQSARADKRTRSSTGHLFGQSSGGSSTQGNVSKLWKWASLNYFACGRGF